MTVSVAVVGAIAVLDLGLVWLLPKSAPEEEPSGTDHTDLPRKAAS